MDVSLLEDEVYDLTEEVQAHIEDMGGKRAPTYLIHALKHLRDAMFHLKLAGVALEQHE